MSSRFLHKHRTPEEKVWMDERLTYVRGCQRDEDLGQLEVGSVVKLAWRGGGWGGGHSRGKELSIAIGLQHQPGHLPGEVVGSPSWLSLGRVWAVRGLSVNEVLGLFASKCPDLFQAPWPLMGSGPHALGVLLKLATAFQGCVGSTSRMGEAY